MNNKNQTDKGTQYTSSDTRDILKLIYKSIDRINFRLKLHPNEEQIRQQLKEMEDNTGKANSDEGKKTDLDGILSQVKVKVKERDYNLIATLEIISHTEKIGYPMGSKNGRIYIYNGKFWDNYSPDKFRRFLEKCYLKMGVPLRYAKRAKFLKQGLEQFRESSLINKKDKQDTLLNFQNCTLKFKKNGSREMVDHNPEDFITYVLPYRFDEKAKCPKFKKYLNEVIPEKDKQKVIAEFLGSVFSDLKHEKVLILYGTGGNGKSVLHDITIRLLGSENVSSHTLESLTGSKLYFIGDLAHSLLNYSGEISTKVNPDMFKKLASGEKVTARYPYGNPFEVENYGRLAFNCNVLPEAKETTKGFFRRFLIIPFEKKITKKQRDRRLAEKIIDTELPGIINWVLDGLERLESQDGFSPCTSAENKLKEYMRNSDTVAQFLKDISGTYSNPQQSSHLYKVYKEFCRMNKYKALGLKDFAQDLDKKGVTKRRKSEGYFYYVNEFEFKS